MEHNHYYSLPDADSILDRRCKEAACMLYGEILPETVEERLMCELEAIERCGSSTLYVIAAETADEVRRLGYRVTTRGMISSSLVAWLCGFSEVNPLPAHYLCGYCCHYELCGEKDDCHIHGFDLPDKICPTCGRMMHPNGADILPEILMGESFDREPEVFLNVAPGIRKAIVEFLKTRFSDAVLLRAGITRTGKDDKQLESVHPGGIYFVPKDLDVSTVTALREEADEFGLPITMHDFSEFYGIFRRCDLLTMRGLGLLHDLAESTGVEQESVPMNDNSVLEEFYSEGFDTFISPGAIPPYGKREIEIAQPKCFSDIVQISGMLHGTGTWDEDTERLLREGKSLSELIAYRDDIVRCLLDRGAERKTAFRIMRRIRQGRGLTDSDENTMKALGIPSWFIDKCKHITYVFPKSHGVESVILKWKLAWYKLNYPEFYSESITRYRH